MQGESWDEQPAARSLRVLLEWLHDIEDSRRDGTRPTGNIIAMLRDGTWFHNLSVVHEYFMNAARISTWLTPSSSPLASQSSASAAAPAVPLQHVAYSSSSSSSAATPAVPLQHVDSSSSSSSAAAPAHRVLEYSISSSSSSAAPARRVRGYSSSSSSSEEPPPRPTRPPPKLPPKPSCPQRLFIDRGNVAHVLKSCPRAALPMSGAKLPCACCTVDEWCRADVAMYTNVSRYFHFNPGCRIQPRQPARAEMCRACRG